jgi:hypothetical protein
MSFHRAAKRCDRGFVAPVLVAKAHIEMPFSDLLDSFSETVRKGYEQRSKRRFGRYMERKMDRKPLLGGPLGYARSASETFRTVSEEVFSETQTVCTHYNMQGRRVDQGEG